MTGIVLGQDLQENATIVHDHLPHVVVLDLQMDVTDPLFVHREGSLHHLLTERVRHLPNQPDTMIEKDVIGGSRVTILQEMSQEGFRERTITDQESGRELRLVARHIPLAEPAPRLGLYHVVLHLPFIRIV